MRPSFQRRLQVVASVLAAAALVAACAAAGERVDWNPTERVYAPYVADPRQARFGIAGVHTDSELEQAGSRRVTLETGGRIDVVRLGPQADPGAGAILDVEAGFIGEFDYEESQDNLAWSGLYALHLSWRAGARVALRLGFAHESSHVGDEFLLETGGGRINYTREELLLGASWTPATAWRLYGEYGHAVERGDESIQDVGRAQAGAEWASASLFGRVELRGARLGRQRRAPGGLGGTGPARHLALRGPGLRRALGHRRALLRGRDAPGARDLVRPVGRRAPPWPSPMLEPARGDVSRAAAGSGAPLDR
jgi:hypothetical protein